MCISIRVTPVDAALTLTRQDLHAFPVQSTPSGETGYCMHLPHSVLRHASRSLSSPRIRPAHQHIFTRSAISTVRAYSRYTSHTRGKMATTTEKVQQPAWEVPVPVEVEAKLKVWNSLTRSKVGPPARLRRV